MVPREWEFRVVFASKLRLFIKDVMMPYKSICDYKQTTLVMADAFKVVQV